MGNYKARVNKANPITYQLLEKTLDNLGNLIENAEETEEDPNENIVFSIDNNIFDVKRKFACRICKV